MPDGVRVTLISSANFMGFLSSQSFKPLALILGLTPPELLTPLETGEVGVILPAQSSLSTSLGDAPTSLSLMTVTFEVVLSVSDILHVA